MLLVDCPTLVRAFKHNKKECKKCERNAMLEIPMMASAAAWLPFCITAIDKRQLSTQRIVEALIIAGTTSLATAIVTALFTVGKMETKFDERFKSTYESMARIEQAVNGAIALIERRRELRDAQIDAIKGDINKLKVDMEKRK